MIRNTLLACFGLVLACSAVIAQQVELSVDKQMLSLPCARYFPAKYRDCPDGMAVNVSAALKGKTRKKPKYEYSVSGGMIVGSGPKVTWDMTKARPGTYVVSVKVYTGSRNGHLSATKTIRVEECADCTRECLGCPRITIQSSNETIGPGDIVKLQVVERWDLKFRWNIEGGEIISGQGTDQVTVRIDAAGVKDDISVRVEVVDGGFCFEVWHCPGVSDLQLPITRPKPH